MVYELDNKHTFKMITVSVLFLVWFFASAFGVFYAWKNHLGWMAPILIGQYLAFFGLIGMLSMIGDAPKNVWFPSIFFIVGLLVFISGLVAHYGDTSMKNALIEVIPYMAAVIFMIIGVGINYINNMIMKRYKQQCIHSVIGECVDFNFGYGKRTLTKSPIYEAMVGEEKRRFTRSIYTGFSNPTLGDKREILVSYDDTDMYLENISDKSIKKFNLILGVIFVVAGFIILISLII